MKFTGYAATIIGAGMLAGCSTTPLTDDVAGDHAHQIIRKIRCEARDALIVQVAGYLHRILDRTADIDKRHALKNLIRKAINHRSNFYRYKDFRDDIIFTNALDTREREFILEHTLAGLVMDFKFDITEQNNNDGEVKMEMPVPNGKFTLGFSGKNNYQRQTENVIKITDQFPSLFKSTKIVRHNGKEEDKCDEYSVEHENKMYPITGKIGMEKIIRNYIEVKGHATKIRGYTQKITFTTEWEGKASPDLTLTTGGFGLKLANVKGNLLSNRKDIHQVDISIAVPGDKPLQKLFAKVKQMRAMKDRNATSRRQFRADEEEAAKSAADIARQEREQERFDRFLDRSTGGVVIRP